MKMRDETGAKWVSVPCWHNCGGRCAVKVLVKDNKILRAKTDDTHPDSWEWPQSRSCALGYAMRHQIFGEDRLKYPMKRKHWEPLTGGDKSLRGRDEWVRISWDEALDAIAAELKNAKEKYGNRSIFYMNMVNLEGYLGSMLSAFGGYVDCSGTQSTGTFGLRNDTFGLIGDQAGSQSNDRMDLENSDYIVLYGHNASWVAFGNPSYYLKHAKEKGSKFVYVAPDYAVTAGFTNAEWIPVRPGEDTALLLGVAYIMITEDENGSYLDEDFINRCTVGFDENNRPADATTDESFKDYVLGKYDGTPKTPEWASDLCGTPVKLIRRFAEILSCKNNVSIHACAAPARNKGSENFPHMLMSIAALGGHFGKPGNGCSNDQYYGAMNSGPWLTLHPFGGPPARFSNAGNPVDDVLSTDSMWDNIIEGNYWFAGSNFPGQSQVPLEQRDIDIHVIISETHNFLQSQSNINRGIEAFRKVDFVCAQAYTLKLDAKYSDIVLPIPTKWETLSSALYSGPPMLADKENVFAWKQALEPLYDTKTDPEIALEIAKRLDLDMSEVIPKTEKQLWFEQMVQAVEMQADGSYFPIAEVTQEDIDRYGVEGNPQPGLKPLEEFLEDGVHRIKRAQDDNFVTIPYQDFRNNPEENPLMTASGKMELYCQAKSDWYDMVNGYSNGGAGALDFVKVSPLPKYLEHPFGYAGTFENKEKGIKGNYPIQMTHNHYPRRAHTDCDNLPWLREAFQNPVFINKDDAAARGIQQGDIIKVYNEQGAFLRPATLSRGIMPGVICVPHGATARIDEESGIDIAGADNMLTPSNRTTTPFLNSWNSVLVNYEKYEGPLEVKADYLMDQIVPKMAQ